MTLKSKLGIAALEELNESNAEEVTSKEDGSEEEVAVVTDAASDAEVKADTDVPAGDDVAAADATPAADDAAVVAADAPAADVPADAPAADAVAATDVPASDDAAISDAAPAAGDDAAAADVPAGDDVTSTDVAPGADPAVNTEIPVDGAAASDVDAGADAVVADATAPDAAAVADGEQAAVADAAASDVAAAGEPGDVVAEVTEVAADPEAEVVEEEMAEVDQIEDQAGDVHEDVEKLAAATESLEGCISVLDAAAQRGGLDIFGASLLRNNVNTVTRSLAVKPLMLPALEDMETPSARISGANSAKDQIVSFIKRIIEAIKSAFIKLGEWIVETYKRLTNALVALERRAETLAGRIKTSTMKEGTLDSKGLAKKLAVAGQVPSDVPAVLTKIADVSKYLNDPKSYKGYLEALDKCEELLKTPEKDEEIRGQISGMLNAWAADLSKKAEREYDPSNKENAAFLWLMGNQTLSVLLPRKAEDIRVMSSSVEVVQSQAVPEAAPALSQAEAEKICQLVASIAKQARESAESNRGGVKELTAEIAKRKDILVGLANAKINGKDEDGLVSEAIRKVALFVNTMLVSSPKLPVHAINRALPRNLSAALDYVAASVGGAAAAEPAAAA